MSVRFHSLKAQTPNLLRGQRPERLLLTFSGRFQHHRPQDAPSCSNVAAQVLPDGLGREFAQLDAIW